MRNFLYLLFVLSICLGIRAFGQEFYSQLETAYQEGRLPETSEMTGYWIGRCVRIEDKTRLLPGIFIHKLVTDEGKFPPTYLSMTSYYEEGESTKFDKYTPQNILQDPKISKWLSTEQWNPVVSAVESLSNFYTLEKGHYQKREVRLYQSDFENILILRGTEVYEREVQERHYCYFNKRVGTIHPDPHFGFTGSVSNQTVEFSNRYPHEALKQIWIKNYGTETVRIKDFRWYEPGSSTVVTVKEFQLTPNAAYRLWIEGEAPFKVSHLKFFVVGHTQNLLVDADPALLATEL